MFRELFRFAALAALASSASALAWESALLTRSATGTYQVAPVSFGGRTWRLLDYSYSGYRLGWNSLATGIPCYAVTISGSGDIADELQQAVTAVGSAGGGTVLIPAGRFTVSHSIGVPYDNVSIAGAGSGLTFLSVPSTYNPASDTDEGVFTLGKAVGGYNKFWIDRGATLAEVSAVIREGDRVIDVADAAAVSTGAWVVVTQYFWPAFSQRNSGGAWPSYSGFPDSGSSDRTSSFAFLRRVIAKSGNRLTLDAPIPWTLDPANNPVRLRSAVTPSLGRLRANLGVAGLSITFADTATGAGGRPAGTGVYFEGVRDGWTYDVQVRNFPRYGMHLDSSARVTLLDSAVYGAQDYGGDGFGYGVNIQDSQNVLVRRFRAEDTRHGFTSRSALTSFLVVTGSESAGARDSDDSHYAPTQGALWDGHRLTYGSGLHGLYRGSQSAGAYETVGSATYWNVRGDGYRGGYYGGSLQLNPSSDGWSLVVGPTGLEVFDVGAALGTGQQIIGGLLQVAGALQAPGPGSRDANVLYEGVGQPDLAPASLYETLLANRVLPQADYSASCRAPPVRGAFTPALFQGSDTLVFDSDHLGYTPTTGSGCVSCNLDSRARNRTAGGRDSFAVQLSASNWSIGGTFRGPNRDTIAFKALRFSVYPTQPYLQFRVGLSRQALPETLSAVWLGEALVGGLTPNQWNTVTVPMTQFVAGRFNSVEVRSTGSSSTTPFFLDDVQLVSAAPVLAKEADTSNEAGAASDVVPDPSGASGSAGSLDGALLAGLFALGMWRKRRD